MSVLNSFVMGLPLEYVEMLQRFRSENAKLNELTDYFLDSGGQGYEAMEAQRKVVRKVDDELQMLRRKLGFSS